MRKRPDQTERTRLRRANRADLGRPPCKHPKVPRYPEAKQQTTLKEQIPPAVRLALSLLLFQTAQLPDHPLPPRDRWTTSLSPTRTATSRGRTTTAGTNFCPVGADGAVSPLMCTDCPEVRERTRNDGMEQPVAVLQKYPADNRGQMFFFVGADCAVSPLMCTDWVLLSL